MAKYEKQLYSLLSKLSLYVENRDELGSIVGYLVVNSLIDFKTTSRDQQEIQFEEVKKVYSGIENVIESCKETDSYNALCDMHIKVNPFLNEIIELQEVEPDKTGSHLLKNISEQLVRRRGSYQDNLRRIGLGFIEEVMAKGAVRRKVDALKKDYDIIKTYFT